MGIRLLSAFTVIHTRQQAKLASRRVLESTRDLDNTSYSTAFAFSDWTYRGLASKPNLTTHRRASYHRNATMSRSTAENKRSPSIVPTQPRTLENSAKYEVHHQHRPFDALLLVLLSIHTILAFGLVTLQMPLPVSWPSLPCPRGRTLGPSCSILVAFLPVLSLRGGDTGRPTEGGGRGRGEGSVLISS